MKVYISGISGTGMGPLALFAKGAGLEVVGSDLSRGAIYDELIKAGISVSIGEQDGEFLKKNLEGLDWFIYTSALPENHPELYSEFKELVQKYKDNDYGIYDNSPDNAPAYTVADAYYGDTSPLSQKCRLLGLPVMIQDVTI